MATFVATPQGFNYDMVPVMAAVLVLVERDRRTSTGVLTALIWVTPLLMMPLNALGVPVTPLLLLAGSLRLSAIIQREANQGPDSSATQMAPA